MKRTFDIEARRWLPISEVVDNNLQPPGYDSIEMTKYMIEELAYYKIRYEEGIVGGVIVTLTGKTFGRIDRIFIDPTYQGKKIGSRAMDLIEEEFPAVHTWDLETSSSQVNNHQFYEKKGYENTYRTRGEYGYIKRKELSLEKDNRVRNEDLSNKQYEECHMEELECYQVSLAGSSFGNSNLMNTNFNNCNLSGSKFQNLNLSRSLYADLNFSQSRFRFVTLNGVRFTDTHLEEVGEPISFERCNLQGTEIRNSDLRNVKITDSDVTGMTIDHIPVEKLLEVYYQTMEKQLNKKKYER
ncbi:GNAT family N-acetyltransferase [Planococcus sp. CAU13]|uniref:GNAT family N-acetyltransferase n=1 Tax=Planococcus sp. CAU13 TaxID=1541197 RepID=UPI00068C1589|nr:GNAT family N-acetyltransferase [Planococcus sp. CAU13]